MNNRKLFHRALGLLCFLMAILYLYETFFPSLLVHTLYSVMAGLLLLFAIFSVRRLNQVTVLLLLSIGTLVLLNQSVAYLDVIHALGENVGLLTLFVAVPFIGGMISTGGYLTALKYKVQEIEEKGKGRPYLLSTLLTSSMGVVLNLGVMPITFRIAESSFSRVQKKKLGLILLRAFTFCMFWSPYFINMGLILVLFDLTWTDIVWACLLLAIVYGLISLPFLPFIRFSDDQPQTQKQLAPSTDDIFSRPAYVSRKLKWLLFWGGLLLSLSFLLDTLLAVSMLTIVSLLALFYPLLWAGVLRVFGEYVHMMTDNVLRAFERLKNELVVFVGAGYFGVALSYTDVGEMMSNAIFHFSFGSIYAMSLLIVGLCILFSLFGIHPVIIVIGIGSSLSPSVFGVSAEFMGMLLIIGWALSTSVSPFSGSVLMTSNLTQESPLVISKQNMLFTLSLWLLLPFVLYLLLTFNLL